MKWIRDHGSFHRHRMLMKSAMEEAGIGQAGVGNGLGKVEQQLHEWRAGRELGERIPAPLWAAALGAAKEHGL